MPVWMQAQNRIYTNRLINVKIKKTVFMVKIILGL